MENIDKDQLAAKQKRKMTNMGSSVGRELNLSNMQIGNLNCRQNHCFVKMYFIRCTQGEKRI